MSIEKSAPWESSVAQLFLTVKLWNRRHRCSSHITLTQLIELIQRKQQQQQGLNVKAAFPETTVNNE